MINYLHGIITLHLDSAIVIECSGVGYEVKVTSVDDFSIGENMFVFTTEIKTESEDYLVGFKTMKEKNMFLDLISVPGIGPKTILSVMKNTSCEQLINAINNGDEAFLLRTPGIGKKFASLLLLKFKGKLTIFDATKNSLSLNKNMDVAFEALKKLGFKESEINDAFKEIKDLDLTSEEYVLKSLQILNG